MRSGKYGLLILVGVIFVFSSVSRSGAEGKIPDEIFVKKCGNCHGKEGKGNPTFAKTLKVDPKLLDLTKDETKKKGLKELVTTTENGLNKMPSFKGKLKPEEIEKALGFLF